MPQRRFAVIVAMLATTLCLARPVAAQDSASASLINQQLDKQVKLQIDGTLPQLMTQVTKETGVPVDAQPEVWELLPWGRETFVRVKSENQTLRQALEAITSKLGLQFVLKDQSIELQPMPALRRLGRKSTISELDALNVLSGTKLELTSDKTDLKTLLDAIDQKLLNGKTPYAIENRTATSGSPVPQNTPVSVPRNANLLEALEAMSTQTPATWYPWGKTVVVLPKSDQVRRQLQTEITLRHDGTDVAQVLSELSMRSGVPFRYEPGTFQELAPQSRQVRLVLNATVLDALEAVCGLTGLGYQIKDNEVYLWNATSTAARPRDRTVAILTTETGMQILISESQCPPDIREFLEYQKTKQFAALRKMMAEQGFKPTNPATQPAAPGRPGEGTAPARPQPPAGQPKAEPGKTEAPGKDL
ncbi:MAG TPA: hypothetical protein VH475_20060 [Tepidisphaeraceae bacterium]|jgi:hypothetical protein